MHLLEMVHSICLRMLALFVFVSFDAFDMAFIEYGHFELFGYEVDSLVDGVFVCILLFD